MKKSFLLLLLVSIALTSFGQIETINNGDTGLEVRNKLNGNFTYLDTAGVQRLDSLLDAGVGGDFIPLSGTATLPGNLTINVDQGAGKGLEIKDVGGNTALVSLTGGQMGLASGDYTNFALANSQVTVTNQYAGMYAQNDAGEGIVLNMNMAEANGANFQDIRTIKRGFEYYESGYEDTGSDLTLISRGWANSKFLKPIGTLANDVDLRITTDGTVGRTFKVAADIGNPTENFSSFQIGNIDDGLGAFAPGFEIRANETATTGSFIQSIDRNLFIGSADGSTSGRLAISPTGVLINKPLGFVASTPSTGNIINIPSSSSGGADAFKIQTSNGGVFMRWDMTTNTENIVFGKTSALATRQLVLKYTHQPSLAGARFDALSIPTKQYVDDNSITGGNGMTKSGSTLNLGGNVNGEVKFFPGTTGTGNFLIGDLFGNRFDRIYNVANRVHFYLDGSLSDNTDVFQVTGTNGIMLALDRNSTVGMNSGATTLQFTDLQSNEFIVTMDEGTRTFSTWISNGTNTTQFVQTPTAIKMIGLPTASPCATGGTGTIWNDAGTLKVCP